MCKMTIGCCYETSTRTHGLAGPKNDTADLIDHSAIGSMQQEVLDL